MGDVAVENPANIVAPHNKPIPSAIPNVESIEGLPTQGGDDYATLKKLQRHLEYIQLQEEYIKDEQRWVVKTDIYQLINRVNYHFMYVDVDDENLL